MQRQSSGSRFNLTREKILQESARVFNRRGYHGTTLDDIARALGVTKAALYYYVKSKEELLYQCHQASWVVLAIVGMSSLVGDFFAKYTIAKAGIYLPLMPAARG